MKIYQVNVTGRFSTGIIANQIHSELLKSGHDSRFAFGLGGETDDRRIMVNDIWHQRLDSRGQRLTGKQGIFCTRSTEYIINDIKTFQPDLIHLHNLHGNYLKLEEFLAFLSAYNVPVLLTLHDCWPFTGGCFHFTVNGCNGWKTNCSDCKFLQHPRIVEKEFRSKRKLFSSIRSLSVVTVSKWLKEVASESLFKNRDISVIYNGIDINTFSPQPTDRIRSQLECTDKKVLLGVASSWGRGKGLKTWKDLSQILGTDYVIILVGLNERQLSELPTSIIGLPRVQNQNELAELYSLADVYINMSLEETFGLPTIEAMACGTPSIVFRSTANPELVKEGTGTVCDVFDAVSVAEAVKTICRNEKKEYSRLCREYVLSSFSVSNMTRSYLEKYICILEKDMNR